MLSNRFRPAILSNSNCISRFRHLRGSFMAAASNFMLGQRDFQMSSLRGLSSNTAASSAIDISTARLKNGFRLKSCCPENYNNVFRNNNNYYYKNNEIKNDRAIGNGVQKARVYSPCVPQLLRVSEEIVKVEDQQKCLNSRAVNGGGDANRGNFAGVLDQPLSDKIMVAVDVDEVLGNFVSALNQFIADRYSLNHSVSEYHVYEFFKIWNCSRDEGISKCALTWVSAVDLCILNHACFVSYRTICKSDIRVHEFFKTHYFKKGIHPLPGAREALQNLSEIYKLSIVTSRQHVIKEHTVEWIEKHYPGLFQEIHFGNHFALDGQSRPKSEICKSLGAKVLIDDNPRYAIECAEIGMKVLLFDYENSYPWCKSEHIPPHPLVTKVHNWEEVEHQLASMVVS
ncbi:hypothetical protein PHJA_001907700 [Phtheirospermum japonicum]|uniref:Tac7077 n=1 Tax=Phtheirospermum japonicum TaxID=374723 RepID=A0A830CEJ7_9LAMI|nr:hypothetical protein PHJA_001907700 [Phtheirospermum japonicum]